LELNYIVGKKIATSAEWPKTSGKFGSELRRLAPQLRLHGMSISFGRQNDGRTITLTSERVPIVPPSPRTINEVKNPPILPIVSIVLLTCCNRIFSNRIGQKEAILMLYSDYSADML
jgi:hypothetical protein